MLSVHDAIEKQLRDHELPSTVSGFLIVTEHFAYLVDDLYWEQGREKQPTILLAVPTIFNQCEQQDTPTCARREVLQPNKS